MIQGLIIEARVQVKLSFTSQRDVAEIRRLLIANAQTNNYPENSKILRFQRSDCWLPEIGVGLRVNQDRKGTISSFETSRRAQGVTAHLRHQNDFEERSIIYRSETFLALGTSSSMRSCWLNCRKKKCSPYFLYSKGPP